jgi:hypothetical protein
MVDVSVINPEHESPDDQQRLVEACKRSLRVIMSYADRHPENHQMVAELFSLADSVMSTQETVQGIDTQSPNASQTLLKEAKYLGRLNRNVEETVTRYTMSIIPLLAGAIHDDVAKYSDNEIASAIARYTTEEGLRTVIRDLEIPEDEKLTLIAECLQNLKMLPEKPDLQV